MRRMISEEVLYKGIIDETTPNGILVLDNPNMYNSIKINMWDFEDMQDCFLKSFEFFVKDFIYPLENGQIINLDMFGSGGNLLNVTYLENKLYLDFNNNLFGYYYVIKGVSL